MPCCASTLTALFQMGCTGYCPPREPLVTAATPLIQLVEQVTLRTTCLWFVYILLIYTIVRGLVTLVYWCLSGTSTLPVPLILVVCTLTVCVMLAPDYTLFQSRFQLAIDETTLEMAWQQRVLDTCKHMENSNDGAVSVTCQYAADFDKVKDMWQYTERFRIIMTAFL